jgi:glyoxylase I family protein
LAAPASGEHHEDRTDPSRRISLQEREGDGRILSEGPEHGLPDGDGRGPSAIDQGQRSVHHVFLDAGNGNILAFFELPNSPPMGRNTNTPEWVQHIAFRVKDLTALEEAKRHVEACGLNVVGPTDHGIFQSIYFFDPSGNRLELTAVTTTPDKARELKKVAPAMLEKWDKTKRPPRHASWVHQKEFA